MITLLSPTIAAAIEWSTRNSYNYIFVKASLKLPTVKFTFKQKSLLKQKRKDR